MSGNKFIMMSHGFEKESSATTRSQNSQNVNSADNNSDYEPEDNDSDEDSDDKPDEDSDEDSDDKPDEDSDDKPDDKPDDESDDKPDDESDGPWSRCPRQHKALETGRCARLTKAFQKIVSNGNLGAYPKRKYYIFAERVCKAYAYLWAKNMKDGLHMNRENTAEAAVAAVYDQIKPRNDQPHSGTI